mmetsp:Transcript_29803/g.54775  ORF Transcript_29803/g.54775 Transcript_29803/m.54775 type:complete len:200 (-) Transcript_29803:518-1117(-)
MRRLGRLMRSVFLREIMMEVDVAAPEWRMEQNGLVVTVRRVGYLQWGRCGWKRGGGTQLLLLFDSSLLFVWNLLPRLPRLLLLLHCISIYPLVKMRMIGIIRKQSLELGRRPRFLKWTMVGDHTWRQGIAMSTTSRRHMIVTCYSFDWSEARVNTLRVNWLLRRSLKRGTIRKDTTGHGFLLWVKMCCRRRLEGRGRLR